MRILLINPVMREDSPPYVFPVGLGIIAAIMQSRGYDVKVFDHNATRCDAGAALREIASAGDVDVIGIGGLITTYKYVKRLIPALREKFPRAKIVLGGGITVEPETIFANIAVDVCVHGEGEHTFLEQQRAGEVLRLQAGLPQVRDRSHEPGLSEHVHVLLANGGADDEIQVQGSGDGRTPLPQGPLRRRFLPVP